MKNSRIKMVAMVLMLIASMGGQTFAEPTPYGEYFSNPDIYAPFEEYVAKIKAIDHEVSNHQIGLLPFMGLYLRGKITKAEMIDLIFEKPEEVESAVAFLSVGVKGAIDDVSDYKVKSTLWSRTYELDRMLKARRIEHNRNVILTRVGVPIGVMTLTYYVLGKLTKVIPVPAMVAQEETAAAQAVAAAETTAKTARPNIFMRLIPAKLRELASATGKIIGQQGRRAARGALLALRQTIKVGGAGAVGVASLVGTCMVTHTVSDFDPIVDFGRTK